MADNVVSARGLSKRFIGTQALEDVSLKLAAGRVQALIGENGTGKSTLIKIMGGFHQADTGTIEVDGVACRFSGPRDAHGADIVMIPQEMRMVPAQTVAENVLLGPCRAN